MAIWTRASWYLFKVLIWISVIISDVEHFFMCPWAIHVFFGGMSIQVFCPFFNWLVWIFAVELKGVFACLGDYAPVSAFESISSHSRGFLLCFLWIPLLCKSSWVWSGPIGLFLLLSLLLWETDPRKHLYSWCQRMFCLCSLPGVLWYLALCLSL